MTRNLRNLRKIVIALATVLAVTAGVSVAVGSASSLAVQPAKITEFTRVVSDTTAPGLTALELYDVDTDGKVDRVVAVFNETLAAYSAGTTPWTLTNVPSGGTLASVSVSGTRATLVLTEGVGAASTAVGTMTVALATSASGIRDAAGNQASFTARAPSDKAGPVPTSVGTTNNGGKNGVGKLQAGDVFWATFSEAILVTSLPVTTTVTEADPAGAVTVDTLNIPGLTSGATSTGGSGYVTTDGGQASFALSATGVYLATTVYVTAGTSCAGSCNALAAGTGLFTYMPAATLTDAAGNGAVGSVATAANYALF